MDFANKSGYVSSLAFSRSLAGSSDKTPKRTCTGLGLRCETRLFLVSLLQSNSWPAAGGAGRPCQDDPILQPRQLDSSAAPGAEEIRWQVYGRRNTRMFKWHRRQKELSQEEIGRPVWVFRVIPGRGCRNGQTRQPGGREKGPRHVDGGRCATCQNSTF